MASPANEMRGHLTCALDLAPDVVDAGTEVTLQIKVVCVPACDLRGHTVSIEDEHGAAAGSVELAGYDGSANVTGEFVLKAPVAAGAHTWTARCPAVVKNGVSYPDASAPVSFTVKPHATSIVAWDIPSSIEAGETFRITVGAKCSKECDFASHAIEIRDEEGALLATAALPADRWPGTTALHAAEVELRAPADEGLYSWSARLPDSTDGIPHAGSAVSFGVRVVAPPDCVVTVETVDVETQAPLPGARVVMHPYKAVTDERGVAQVRVARGSYKLFVSQSRYVTLGLPVDVTTDMKARAELSLEPVRERN